jgi:hypothetical protein
MTNSMQSDSEHLRVALDHGEVVELDGGTLVLGGEESPSVGLRLAPWRAVGGAGVRGVVGGLPSVPPGTAVDPD